MTEEVKEKYVKVGSNKKRNVLDIDKDRGKMGKKSPGERKLDKQGK